MHVCVRAHKARPVHLYMYRILPSKCPSPCKRPPPFFYDPMVRVYMRYTYKWLLRVNAHPHLLARELQAPMGNYSGDYSTPTTIALFRHLAEQKPPEPTPDRPDGAEDEPEGTSAAGQEEDLGRAHQTEVEATPERSGSPPTRAATESVPQPQDSMEEGQSKGPNSVIDVRMLSILQGYYSTLYMAGWLSRM